MTTTTTTNTCWGNTEYVWISFLGYLKKLEIEENLTDLYRLFQEKHHKIWEKVIWQTFFNWADAIKYMNNMDITKKILLLMPMSDPKRATTPKPMALK